MTLGASQYGVDRLREDTGSGESRPVVPAIQPSSSMPTRYSLYCTSCRDTVTHCTLYRRYYRIISKQTMDCWDSATSPRGFCPMCIHIIHLSETVLHLSFLLKAISAPTPSGCGAVDSSIHTRTSTQYSANIGTPRALHVRKFLERAYRHLHRA